MTRNNYPKCNFKFKYRGNEDSDIDLIPNAYYCRLTVPSTQLGRTMKWAKCAGENCILQQIIQSIDESSVSLHEFQSRLGRSLGRIEDKLGITEDRRYRAERGYHNR